MTMNPYQQFIAKSRYARHLPLENRREDWDESVKRWMDFMTAHVAEFTTGGLLHLEDSRTMSKEFFPWADIEKAMLNLEVLPSMRSMMVAGPALKRSHETIFNCAYLTMDSVMGFTETMWLLSGGSGVGFSVEKKYVSKLPVISELNTVLSPDPVYIVVEDSREGWTRAWKILLNCLYTGKPVGWDLSKVRPKGTRLKTMGGRASGPEPLNELFLFACKVFNNARGRQLKPIEVHDILCKIAQAIVVGGVRRSAMISLGDLDDQEHRDAKKGDWWILNPQRALANNSAVYIKGEFTWTQFDEEWEALRKSGSGERGIFNRSSSQQQAARFGRNPSIEYGTNPCSEIILRPQQFCNLSTVVVKPRDNEVTLHEKVRLATIMGTIQATFTVFNHEFMREEWASNAVREPLLGVSMTGVYSNKLLSNPQTHHEFLSGLRSWAHNINRIYAGRLGIKAAPAVTCIKPEGTVSQLTETSAGLHPDHSPYYIRRVRNDTKDPLTQFMKDQGIPNEVDFYNSDATVFSFPQKREGITRDNVDAIEHLELWKKFQQQWCSHKPSVTVNVDEHEWGEVKEWLVRNFDEVTGIAFLPKDGGTYKQAPYEAITQEQWAAAVEALPELDWSLFREEEDNFQEKPECFAGVCEI
jgi:ribonucleoside-triphosphate reductase